LFLYYRSSFEIPVSDREFRKKHPCLSVVLWDAVVTDRWIPVETTVQGTLALERDLAIRYFRRLIQQEKQARPSQPSVATAVFLS